MADSSSNFIFYKEIKVPWWIKSANTTVYKKTA